ncbi:DUF5906 domain-containing protein [Haloarcula sp. S1AR25-5A]|uniref:DUF5906 domain-containing protein n=1 Tax=Haloarcula terrestris TaxID=2950533 RepID=A0AAE4JL95_9EURY|nr:DUF5906 domain-containing protein [Haloarcula terrestris]MDS0223806.1 DUF5906 domain-containing protein [Haloarcula terrestris]
MTTVSFEPEVIPEELKERDQWLLWDASNDTPRQPHWRGNFRISWSDPNDWHPFEEAVEAAEEVDSWGIGYVMAKDNDSHPTGLYGCLDLDGCLTGPESPKDWLPSLADFIDEDAYIERSPSGDGLHIPLVGQEAPEWWSDCHFSDDEHEGVEFLTNKFCTFTGDALNAGHGGVGAVDPTDFLFHAHTEIEGENPRVEPSETARRRGDSDLELEREDIEDALSHIGSSCAYPKWRDIAFAVHDWDSGTTGKNVFESWSRGPGWDEQSQRYIDAIWNGAEQGNGVTVGTLIHHAKEAGWTPPSRSSKGHAVREAPDTPEPAEGAGWEDVRQLYALAQEDSDIDKGPARQAAEGVLEDETSWMCVNESDQLWVYDSESGTYGKYGEQVIGTTLKKELGPHYTKAERSEVIARIKDGNRVFRRELNARQHDGALLCVGNGVVNFDTGKMLDHDPEYRFVRGLDTDFPTPENGLEADKERVLEFMDDITQREADRDTLLDHLAHGLMPGHPYRAFVVTFGPGGNGKTQLAQLFTGFVGEDNAASVEIDELVNDDFATGDLPGKFLNWGDDMSGDGGGTLQELSTLKKASGGSNIRANEKYEKTFNFQNEAALFFSANEPPRFGEVKPSIKDRLYPIEMPYRFVSDPDPDDPMEKEKVPKVAQRLLEDAAAMRGLLELAVEHGQRLRENRGEYSMPEEPDERFDIYNQEADPIVRFAGTVVEPADGSMKIRKDDAYRVYQSVMDAWQERAASERGFKRQFPGTVDSDVETARSRALATDDDEDDRVRCWKRIRWTEEATQYMPDWMQDRYTDHFDDAVDADSANVDNSDRGDELPLSPTEVSTENMADNGRLPAIEATVTGKHMDRFNNRAGHLSGDNGGIDYTAVSTGADTLPSGATVRVVNAKLTKSELGALELEIDPTTEVAVIDTPDTDTDSVGDGEAATDGGEAVETDETDDDGQDTDSDAHVQPKPIVMNALYEAVENNDNQPAEAAEVLAVCELPEAVVLETLEELKTEGAVQPMNGGYIPT